MDRGYGQLYAAIWKQAYWDDSKRLKMRIVMDTAEAIFPRIARYSRESRKNIMRMGAVVREMYGSSGEQKFNRLMEEIERYTPKLERALKEKLVREAEWWPNNRGKDEEFEEQYKQIRSTILKQYKEAIV